MPRRVNIGRCVDPGDFDRLVGFLETIGFVRRAPDHEAFGKALGFKGALFVVPSATISISSLSPDLPPGFAKGLRDAAFGLRLEGGDTALIYETATRMKMPVRFQDSALGWSPDQPFTVSLPGNIVLAVRPNVETPANELYGDLNARGKKFGIVVARFNSFITERLLESALDGLHRTGASPTDVKTVRVPGAFEIPSAARILAETKKYDAIICIGCLLRGDTAHYDVIVNEVTRGIGQSAQETGVPHAFGVLTCDTLEQAIDRAGLKMGNKGFEAALAAVEMVSLKQAISSQPSAISEKQVPHPRAVRGRNDKKRNKATGRKKR